MKITILNPPRVCSICTMCSMNTGHPYCVLYNLIFTFFPFTHILLTSFCIWIFGMSTTYSSHTFHLSSAMCLNTLMLHCNRYICYICLVKNYLEMCWNITRIVQLQPICNLSHLSSAILPLARLAKVLDIWELLLFYPIKSIY